MGAQMHQEQYKGGVKQSQPAEIEAAPPPRFSKEIIMGMSIFLVLLHSGLMFGVVPMVAALKKVPNTDFFEEEGGPENPAADKILSTGHMITSFGAFLAGPVPDKLGPRVTAIAGLLIEAGGQVLISQVRLVGSTGMMIGYGFLGLGGTMVLMGVMMFADAFSNGAFLLAVITGAFDAGGLVFMLLPVLGPDIWSIFFIGYAVFAVVCAVAVFIVFPDQNLPEYSEDEPEENDLAEMGAAMKEKTLAQVLLRPGMIMFLLTFTITGSGWVYGDSAFGSVIGDKAGDQEKTIFGISILEIWQPLIASSTFPVCLLVGHLAEKYGIGVAAFMNIFFVQLFLVGLWQFGLQMQFVTMLFFNLAGGAMFTVQNVYVCGEGYNHVGTVYGVTNLVMALGNMFDGFWLNQVPAGSFLPGSWETIHENLPIGCMFWIFACCPMYVWPIYEIIKTRREKNELEQLTTASFTAAPVSLDIVKVEPEPETEFIKSSKASKSSRAFPLLTETDNEINTAPERMDNNSGLNGGTDPFEQGQARMERQLHQAIAKAQGATPAISWNPVVTVNPQGWAGKVQQMLQAGKDEVFFVVDFDKTMTKCFLEDGSRGFDSHDILASCPKMTWGCKRMMEMLMKKYHPIQTNPRMTKEEKVPYMEEWSQLVNQLLLGQGLTRDDLETAVRTCMDFRLRHGVQELFQIAHSNNIPLVIISAGPANVVEEVICQCIKKSNGELGTPWDNLFIHGNSMLWNHDGRHVGFSEPQLHMFNKDLRSAPQRLQQLIQGRHSGILCGDTLGDLTMATGHSTTSLMKVGFLNDKIDERLEHFCKENAYDRVILGDGTFEPLLQVLRQL